MDGLKGPVNAAYIGSLRNIMNLAKKTIDWPWLSCEAIEMCDFKSCSLAMMIRQTIINMMSCLLLLKRTISENIETC